MPLHQAYCLTRTYSCINFSYPNVRQEIPLLGNFSPKNQNCQFKLEFSIYTNSNVQNLMVVLTFSVFDQEYTFWANLVQKIETVSLSRNLVPRLIRICRSQRWSLLFLFWTRNILFKKIWSKKSKLSVSAKISNLD